MIFCDVGATNHQFLNCFCESFSRHEYQGGKRIRSRFSNATSAEVAVRDFKQRYWESTGVAIKEAQRPKLPKVVTSWFVLPFCFVLGGSRLPRMLQMIRVGR